VADVSPHRVVVDDLGHIVDVPRPARRVVSLVPSLTEALASIHRDRVVAATDCCNHPVDLDVVRIRGTKNPDTRAIIALAPDLVVANQEENRELDVQRLRNAGVPVWVTRIRSVDEAFSSIERLFDVALGWQVPGWLPEARGRWAAPPAPGGPRVAVAIWRDPWMVVGGDTFADDMLARLGCVNAFHDSADRYPTMTVEQIEAMGVDLVLLPDEPYAFTPADGPDAFVGTPTAFVSGRLLTWYGPSLLPARSVLESSILSR
jgi:ABC-type Fe3+-hydroxamate transport system substrate-binding protein